MLTVVCPHRRSQPPRLIVRHRQGRRRQDDRGRGARRSPPRAAGAGSRSASWAASPRGGARCAGRAIDTLDGRRPSRARRSGWRRQLPRRLADLLMRSGAFESLVAAAPGGSELITIDEGLGARAAPALDAARRPYDLVIVDAPASGHGAALLRAPRRSRDIARVGPIGSQAREVADFLKRDAGFVIVTTARGDAGQRDARARAAAARTSDLDRRQRRAPRRFSAADVEKLRGERQRRRPARGGASRMRARARAAGAARAAAPRGARAGRHAAVDARRRDPRAGEPAGHGDQASRGARPEARSPWMSPPARTAATAPRRDAAPPCEEPPCDPLSHAGRPKAPAGRRCRAVGPRSPAAD